MIEKTPLEYNQSIMKDVEALQGVMMQLSWASQRRLAHELNDFGLTIPQFVALRALSRHPQGCSMKELAESVQQVSATMTGIVDRLVEHGWVERQQVPADRRSLRVLLTPAGQELLVRIDRQNRLRLGRVLNGMSKKERREMLRLMQNYLEITLEEMEEL